MLEQVTREGARGVFAPVRRVVADTNATVGPGKGRWKRDGRRRVQAVPLAALGAESGGVDTVEIAQGDEAIAARLRIGGVEADRLVERGDGALGPAELAPQFAEVVPRFVVFVVLAQQCVVALQGGPEASLSVRVFGSEPGGGAFAGRRLKRGLLQQRRHFVEFFGGEKRASQFDDELKLFRSERVGETMGGQCFGQRAGLREQDAFQVIGLRLAGMSSDQAIESGQRFRDAARFVQRARGGQRIGPVLRTQFGGFDQQGDAGFQLAGLHREAAERVVGFGVGGITQQNLAEPRLRLFQAPLLQQAQCIHARG